MNKGKTLLGFQQLWTVVGASAFDSFFLMFATASYHKTDGPFFSTDIIN